VNAIRQLNFQSFHFKLKEEQDKTYIFDEVRSKYLVLTPEEWVRQHCVHYLVHLKQVPPGLISVEKGIKLNGKRLRYDAVVYSKQGNPVLLVECKAPEVSIVQETFHQIAAYNIELDVPFLWVTNGLKHFFCYINKNEKKVQYLKELPNYLQMNSV
jgi:type I site-specific restriction endonuclease